MELEFLSSLSKQPAYGVYHTPVDLSSLSHMESVWGGIRFITIILSSWSWIPNDIFLSHFAIKAVCALSISFLIIWKLLQKTFQNT